MAHSCSILQTIAFLHLAGAGMGVQSQPSCLTVELTLWYKSRPQSSHGIRLRVVSVEATFLIELFSFRPASFILLLESIRQ